VKKTLTLANYRDRVMRVVDYIWKNSERDIDVNHLAEVAHFSPYHFHRIYREMMHENVNATVRRLRLHKASNMLLQSDKKIEDIALSCGYGAVESFTRAFKKTYDYSPAQYRQERRKALAMPCHLPDTLRTYPMSHPIEIVDLETISLGGRPHTGSCAMHKYNPLVARRVSKCFMK
jgi:AraC family transcriptional regulator